MVGYLFTYFIFISTNDVKLVLNYIYDSIVRIRIHACLLGMPTTHRTNDYTTPSLALTNGSTFIWRITIIIKTLIKITFEGTKQEVNNKQARETEVITKSYLFLMSEVHNSSFVSKFRACFGKTYEVSIYTCERIV